MLKKTIKYVDFNGNEREEDFWFNLNKAELMEMEMSVKGGLGETIRRVSAAQDTPTIIKIFKDLILRAYGVKSLDGREFEKSDDISRRFAQTNAYSELFMELATNAEAAAEFVNGIVPKGMQQDASKILPMK